MECTFIRRDGDDGSGAFDPKDERKGWNVQRPYASAFLAVRPIESGPFDLIKGSAMMSPTTTVYWILLALMRI